jgi:hypothetical protein
MSRLHRDKPPRGKARRVARPALFARIDAGAAGAHRSPGSGSLKQRENSPAFPLSIVCGRVKQDHDPCQTAGGLLRTKARACEIAEHGRQSKIPPPSTKKVKPAGKPGSVTGIAPYDGHSSRRRVAPALQPPTRGLERAAHDTQACACRIRLFGVAPGGGYRVSPLGRQTRGQLRAPVHKDSSLWPYSSSSPKASLRLVRTAVSRHPALWSPDFPLRTLRHAATVWPASQADFST